MNEFGKELRQERESRGIALAAITESTKINGRYLLALENGQFDHLPGGVINRGIMRSYACAVGLNEKTWVDRFMTAYRASGQLTDEDASWIAFAENVGKSRPRESKSRVLTLKWAGVAMLVVVLVALGWLVWHFSGNKATAEAFAPQPAATAAMLAQPSHN